MILQGNFAVSPILTLTFMIGGGLSIAASELNLSTGGGNELLTMGLPVSTKTHIRQLRLFNSNFYFGIIVVKKAPI